jgi:hypothetical protein
MFFILYYINNDISGHLKALPTLPKRVRIMWSEQFSLTLSFYSVNRLGVKPRGTRLVFSVDVVFAIIPISQPPVT